MANQGVSPIDPTTLVGQVRLLVGDTDAKDSVPAVTGMGDYNWYSDSDITGLLGLYNNEPKRVAILVLSNVAISESLKLKVWTENDLSVNGAAITEAIRKVIADLRADLDRDDSFFDVVDPFPLPPFIMTEGTVPYYPLAYPYISTSFWYNNGLT